MWSETLISNRYSSFRLVGTRNLGAPGAKNSFLVLFSEKADNGN